MTADHTFPTDERLDRLRAEAEAADGPVVMLNLNRYRDVAAYGDERDAEGLSGRHAYLRYGIVAKAAIDSLGGAILWVADAAGAALIGCDHDAYDEVVAVWYPSRAAFLALEDFPGYREALEHRDAAIDQAALLPFVGDPGRVLRSPFDA